MLIYLAAAYAARDIVRRDVVPQLVAAGHTIGASWLIEDHAITSETIGAALGEPDSYVDKQVEQDFEEVRAADAVVHLTESFMRQLSLGLRLRGPGVLTTGGRHVECGYALALGKLVVTVGEPENVFARSVTQVVPDIAEAIKTLDLVSALETLVPIQQGPGPS